ncbi:FabD/lysophospholipase-like protein, partial [Myriangium duriaei CBS 260.36]
MPDQQINLLCIDGGGFKGLSALVIIRKIMELVDHNCPPKPCEFFRMIGGTGTGGLIAIMLGRLEMTVDECMEEYVALHATIFKKSNFWNSKQVRYDYAALEAGLKRLLRQKRMDEQTLLKNSSEQACKVFVTATSAGSCTLALLSSYYRRRGVSELYDHARILDAVKITIATATGSGPVSIGPTGRQFLDGETGANNPVFTLWEEAESMFSGGGPLEQYLNCMVSVGCGIRSLERFSTSPARLARLLANIATETEETAKRFQHARHAIFDKGIYHRFSAPSVGDIALDDFEDKLSIIQMTDSYIDSKEFQDRMSLCESRM